MKIHVSNLGNRITDESLQATFATFGEVSETIMMKDETTGRSSGFALLEMPDPAAAQRAVARMNGTVMDGCIIKVTAAVQSNEPAVAPQRKH